jgi:CubicO group peptidase (beta-lactamase class C family)
MNDGQIDGQRVLAPELIAIMSTPHANIPGSDRCYGYGLELETRRGVRWVQHEGSRAGYGSTIRMAPERKFAVIITANRTGSSMPKLAEAISEAMLPLEPEVHSQAPLHVLTAAELKGFAGVYGNGVNRVRLEIADGALTEGKKRFTRAGNGFLSGDGESERLVFVPDSTGRIEFVFAGGRAFRRVE